MSTGAHHLPPAELLGAWVPRLVGLDDLVGPVGPIDLAGSVGPMVVVGCSGGADSSALLLLAAAAGLQPHAVFVGHGLNDAAHDDAAAASVAGLAGRLGVPWARRDVVVTGRGGVEAAARRARYDALGAYCAEVGAAAVLVGHTADDQAETMVLNLLRGAATGGLGAMAPARGPIRRPLLELRRADTLEICALAGHVPVRDPMNDSGAFRRVWLRREIVPVLEAGAERDLVTVLARQAAILRSESDHLDARAAELLDGAGNPPSAAVLASADPVLVRRALRLLVGDPAPSAARIDDACAVVQGVRRSAQMGLGRTISRQAGRIVVTRAGAAEPSIGMPVTLSVPGTSEIDVTTALLRVESRVEGSAPVAWPDGRYTCVADADAVRPPLVLRATARHDTMRPLGMSGTKRVAAVQSLHPVRSVRSVQSVGEGGATGVTGAVPPMVVVDSAGTLVWAVGYRIDDRVRVRTETRRFLWVTVDEV